MLIRLPPAVYYKDHLFSSAYNLYKMDRYAISDFVLRFFFLLNETKSNSAPSIPTGFDPMGYLLLNPDIVYLGVNPYSHYIDNHLCEDLQHVNNLLDANSLEAETSDGLKNTNDKKIIFLIGGPKTGSKALQSFLEINSDLLKSFGFLYKKNNIPANGYLLYDLLKNNIVTDEQLDHAIWGFIDHYQNSICSSEFLSFFNESEWSRIHQSCNRLDIDFTIIFYIRNLVPFFYSSYNQNVKGLGECRSVYGFLQTFSWAHLNTLRVLHNCIEIDRIKVFHYDSICSKNIIQHFFSVTGIDDYIELGSTDHVNRSLTLVELSFIRGLNKCLARYSSALSYHLIDLRPEIKAALKYDRSVVSLLEQRFQNDIEWINRTFFDHDVVGLLTKSEPTESNQFSNASEQTQQQQADESLLVMKALCERIADMSHFDNIREHVFQFSISVLPLTNRVSSYENDIPADFNPVEYLLLNPDVVFAGENAYEHYLSYGKSEGRDYKFVAEKFGRSTNDLVFDDVVVSRPVGALSIATPILSMIPNEQVVLDVAVTNNGQKPWVAGLFRTVNFSYHWLDAEWNMVVYEGERTLLPTSGVPSGQTVLAKMTVVVPPDAGIYHLVLTLVQEFEGWFDEMGEGFHPAILKIEVG